MLISSLCLPSYIICQELRYFGTASGTESGTIIYSISAMIGDLNTEKVIYDFRDVPRAGLTLHNNGKLYGISSRSIIEYNPGTKEMRMPYNISSSKKPI